MSSGINKYKKIHRKYDFILLQISTFLLFGAFNMTLPILSGAAERTGATGTMTGLITGGFAVVSLVTRPITSHMADIFNRKMLYKVSIMIAFISYIGYGAAKWPAVLLLVRYFHGFSMGIIAPVCAILSASYAEESYTCEGVGIFAVVQTAASGIGPSVGIWITSHFGYEACFFTAAVIMASVFCVFQLLTDKQNKTRLSDLPFLLEKIKHSPIISTRCIVPSVLVCLLITAFSGFNGYIVQIAGENGIHHTELFYVFYTSAVLLVRKPVSQLSSFLSEAIVLIPSCILFIVSLIVCSTASSMGSFILGAVLLGSGYGSCFALLLVICNYRVPDSEKGLANGTCYIGIDLGYMIGPVLAGYLSTRMGYRGMAKCLIIPLIMFLIIRLFSKRYLQPYES